jgi:Fur family peroxide stress response transcriptional regulator
LLIGELRRSGIRVTAQRLAVAEALASSKDHPTAQEVYERVQSRIPHITMATVYNTVNTLAKSGLIQLLSFPDGARYDANPAPHANLVCVQCHQIIDAVDDADIVGRLREEFTAKNGFQVISQRVDFYGLCPDCAARQPQQEAVS